MTFSAGVIIEDKHVEMAQQVCETIKKAMLEAETWEEAREIAVGESPTKAVANTVKTMLSGFEDDDITYITTDDDFFWVDRNVFYIDTKELDTPTRIVHNLLGWAKSIARAGETVMAREYYDQGESSRIHVATSSGIAVYDLDRQFSEHQRAIVLHGEFVEDVDLLTQRLCAKAAEAHDEVGALRAMLREALSSGTIAHRGLVAEALLNDRPEQDMTPEGFRP